MKYPFLFFFFFILLSFATYAEDLHIRFGGSTYNVSNQFIPLNNKNTDNVLNKSVIGVYPLGNCGTDYSLSIFKNSLAQYTWVNCTATSFNLASYRAAGDSHVDLVIDLGNSYYFLNMTAFRLNFTNDFNNIEVNGHDFGQLTLLDSDKNIAYTTGICYTSEFYKQDCQYRESSGWGNKNVSYFINPSGLSNYINYTAFNNQTQFTYGHNVRYIVLTNAVGMINYSIYNLDIYGVTQFGENQLPTASVSYQTPCFNSTVSYVDVPITVACTDPEGDTCYYSDKAISPYSVATTYNQNWITSDSSGNRVFNPNWHDNGGWSYSNGTTSTNLIGWAFNDYMGICDNNIVNSYFWAAYYGIPMVQNTYCMLDVKGGAAPIYWKYPTSTNTNNFRINFQVPESDMNFSFYLLDNAGKQIYNVNFNISNHSQLWVNDIALWEDNHALFNTSQIYSLYIGNYSIIFNNESYNSQVNSNFSGLNTAWFDKISTIKLESKAYEGLSVKYVSLYAVLMWYIPPAAQLFNWTSIAPTNIRITTPTTRLNLFYTDSVHKDINYTKLDYIIDTKQNCQGMEYNPINGSSTVITDNTRNYLDTINNGKSIFNYIFYALLLLVFFIVIYESESLEISLVLSGLAGLAASWILSGDVTQMVSSASLIGMGVTLFVSKSFI